MSLGTITINSIRKAANSSLMIVDMSVEGDDSYTTGGTATAEAVLRAGVEAGDGLAGSLSNLDLVGCHQIDGSDVLVRYDADNDTLIVRDIGDAAEKGNGTDQSGDTYRLSTSWG